MPVQIRNSNTILELPSTVAKRVESGVNIVTLPDPASPVSPLVLDEGEELAELQFKVDGVLRWGIRLDAGNLLIRRHDEAGEYIDAVQLNGNGGVQFPGDVTADGSATVGDGLVVVDGEVELHAAGVKRGSISLTDSATGVDIRLYNGAGDLISAATFGDSGAGGLALDSGLTLGVLGGGLPSMTSVGQVVLQGGLSASGGINLPDGLPEYADDAAAAVGLLPIHSLYRTGSVVKIRVG